MASLSQTGSNRERDPADAISAATNPYTANPPSYKKTEAAPGGDDEETASKRIEVPLDAFGDETNAEIQYKTMKWWQASMGRFSPCSMDLPPFSLTSRSIANTSFS
jgi:hypothetical protein